MKAAKEIILSFSDKYIIDWRFHVEGKESILKSNSATLSTFVYKDELTDDMLLELVNIELEKWGLTKDTVIVEVIITAEYDYGFYRRVGKRELTYKNAVLIQMKDVQ